MRNRKLLLGITSLIFILNALVVIPSFAQNLDFTNKELARIADPTDSPHWLYFKSEMKLSATDVFKNYKAAFKLSENDEMQLIKTQTDQLGITHYKYQQTYKSLKVEGAEFSIHEERGLAIKANGYIIPELQINSTASISKEDAIAIAKKYLPASEYMWEDKALEDLLKETTQNPAATYVPAPELLIAYIDADNLTKDGFVLAYKIDIHAKTPHNSQAIYVAANTGEVVKSIQLLHDCNSGAGCTLFNGFQGIRTNKLSNTLFELHDDCIGIETRRFPNTMLLDFGSNNIWSASSQCEGVSVHYAARKTYDYFFQQHQLDSYDGAGGKINIFTQNNGFFGLFPDNAFWDPNALTMNFGAGNGGFTNNPMVSLDITGHEFAHGVTQFSAGLVYQGESGALNESFSDIFGTMIEFSAFGGANYLIGEDMWIVDGYLRSMQDPKAKNQSFPNSNCPGGVISFAQPDTYLGDNWINTSFTSCDVGGVHINSGVQNHWFYLLAEGSDQTDGVNDNGDNFNLSGIGRSKAARIAYRSLANYLTSASNYAAARASSIEAAIDLFGPCSFEVEETRRAWDAVGVYGGPPTVGCYITGPGYVNCGGAVFTALDIPNVNSFTWSFSTNCAFISTLGTHQVYVYSSGNCSFGGGLLCATPNDPTGSCNTCCITLGIENCNDGGWFREAELEEEKAPQVFPNPAFDEVNIKLPTTTEEMQVTLFDLSGKKIKTLYQENVSQVSMDISELNMGIYLLRVNSPAYNFTERIMKK